MSTTLATLLESRQTVFNFFSKNFTKALRGECPPVSLPMTNKRDPNKIRVQTWVTKEDKRALEKIAKDKGYSNLAEFLSAIAAGTVKLMLLVGVGRWMLGASLRLAYGRLCCFIWLRMPDEIAFESGLGDHLLGWAGFWTHGD